MRNGLFRCVRYVTAGCEEEIASSSKCKIILELSFSASIFNNKLSLHGSLDKIDHNVTSGAGHAFNEDDPKWNITGDPTFPNGLESDLKSGYGSDVLCTDRTITIKFSENMGCENIAMKRRGGTGTYHPSTKKITVVMNK